MTEAKTTLLRGADLNRLLVYGSDGYVSEDVAAVVRFGLGTEYHLDAAGAHPTTYTLAIEDMLDEMLRNGHITEAILLIQRLPDDIGKASRLADAARLTASTDLARTRNLVVQSLSIEMTSEVVEPLAALGAAAIHELGRFLLGASVHDSLIHNAGRGSTSMEFQSTLDASAPAPTVRLRWNRNELGGDPCRCSS